MVLSIAQWEECPNQHDPRDTWVQCSKCGYKTTTRFAREYNFCPNCGLPTNEITAERHRRVIEYWATSNSVNLLPYQMQNLLHDLGIIEDNRDIDDYFPPLRTLSQDEAKKMKDMLPGLEAWIKDRKKSWAEEIRCRQTEEE